MGAKALANVKGTRCGGVHCGDSPCDAAFNSAAEVIYTGPSEPASDALGDLCDTQAMTNHLLLKASRDGDLQGTIDALDRCAYVETRRPFLMTPEAASTTDHRTRLRGTGFTPLMYAAQGGYIEIAKLLVKAKAATNAQDEDGMRSLHFAAAAGQLEMCRFLVEAGADRFALDDDGRTPISHVPESELESKVNVRRWNRVLGTMPSEDGCLAQEDVQAAGQG
eukprot:TRINITY_DN42926_c0_g1_i1.p1 TRINITY_DN42926_c0_g1~~TRINITY_DN42926_c0_g1_i1.p1  ORF type:complete len:222 (+),score=42.63 TRINITY_DN42926_c0_g1_i1:153-818(+)